MKLTKNLILWFFICIQLPVPAVARPCSYLRGMYFGDHGLYGSDRPITLFVTSSNAGFKRQTKYIFDDVGILGQNFTKALHAFFNANIHELADNNSIKLKPMESNYIKFNEITVHATPDIIDGLGSIVFDSQRNALADMAEMLFDGSQRHVTTLQGVLSLHEIQAIQTAVQRKFKSMDALVDYLKDDYGVGVDKTLVGSHFMTKYTAMTSLETSRQVFFTTDLFQHYVQRLLQKRVDLSWAFENSQISLLDTFSLIRRHQDIDSPALWTPAYKALLVRRHQGVGQPAYGDLLLAHGELMDYVRDLNVFDFLPRDVMKTGTATSGDFRKFKNPSGYIYVDMRKLGAHNMVLMHELVPQLQQQMLRAEQIKTRLSTIEDPTTEDIRELRLALAEILNSRQEVLRQSADLLDQVFNTTLQVFEGLGINSSQRMYWRAGDDIIVLFRSDRHSAKDVTRFVKNHPFLKRQVRVGAEDVRGRESQLSLEQVRLRAGLAAAPLKILESLDLPYEVSLTMKTNGNQDADFTLYEMDSGGDMIPIDPLLNTLVLRRLDRAPMAVQSVP